MIRILLAGDDKDIQASLAMILGKDPDIQLLDIANNGVEAVALAKSLKPDLILMDIGLPYLDGLEATKQIKAYFSVENLDVKILILSTFYDDDYVMKSQEYNVDGYLLKGLAFDKLISSIKNTYDGLITLDKVVYEKGKRLGSGHDKEKRSSLSLLSDKELEILKLITSGCKNSEISTTLFLSEGTVRNYISNILLKLNVKNSRELSAYGIKAGL